MKINRFTISFLCLIFSHSLFAKTQMELNQSACNKVKVTEQKIEKLIKRIHKKHQKDNEFLSAFDNAQSAWQQFRDKHLKAAFPKENTQQAYGSIYPLCYCQLKAKLNRSRIHQLKQWLIKHQEGDPCIGSRL